METNPIDAGAIEPMATVIDVFSRKGYDATTVDDLADAVGLSRSTFFRRYGSKEDVVFADHELLLQRAESYLEASPLPPLQAVCAGARLVFDHHVARRGVSVARFALLHDVPALRDRELIMSHRYERAFAQYLRAALPDDERSEFVSIAFSAAVVAVHNAVLRQWLFDPGQDLTASLDVQLRALVKAFSLARPGARSPRIVVTVFDSDADNGAVLESIRASLP